VDGDDEEEEREGLLLLLLLLDPFFRFPEAGDRLLLYRTGYSTYSAVPFGYRIASLG